MLKITIKAADEATFHRMLLAFVELSLERFDTDALLDEARHRLGRKGYAVDVVPDRQPEPETQPAEPAKRRPGRSPRNTAAAAEAEPVRSAPQAARPAPSRDEIIAALEKYALMNGRNPEDGMLKARGIMAEISGVRNAALKDVDPRDYLKLMEALA